ncbi:hypothetical protein [Shewanella sp. UCD-KL12]|uniref:hypothetical protein n=1 Tax=Shewanella sp. UCD-KL12 TaxID=1917163 RepID=UPI0021169FE2|nr:hypothetical protein [Shewanella sp. UCD-KL12]
MLTIADENKNGSFIITNDKETTYFIETKIKEIITQEDGSIVRKEYTKDNVDSWGIAVSNPRFIIEPGRTKNLGVRAICGELCDVNKDKTYELLLIPRPYNSMDEDIQQSISIFVGYAPIFIIPSENPEIAFDISVDHDVITIHNNSNTLIRVLIDNCTGVKNGSCSTYYTLIEGREKKYSLPQKLIGENLNISILNHDESYNQKIIIPSNGRFSR